MKDITSRIYAHRSGALQDGAHARCRKTSRMESCRREDRADLRHPRQSPRAGGRARRPASSRSSTAIICLGDICFGPQAHECLERVRALGCPVILGNWDSWSIDGFPLADDPVGIMLYEIGALVGQAPDRRRPRVHPHVCPDARGAARGRLADALLPRLAALVLRLDLRDDPRRRRRGACSPASTRRCWPAATPISRCFAASGRR